MRFISATIATRERPGGCVRGGQDTIKTSQSKKSGGPTGLSGVRTTSSALKPCARRDTSLSPRVVETLVLYSRVNCCANGSDSQPEPMMEMRTITRSWRVRSILQRSYAEEHGYERR